MAKPRKKDGLRKAASLLGQKGGKKASERMTPAEREERARKAAAARWGKAKRPRPK